MFDKTHFLFEILPLKEFAVICPDVAKKNILFYSRKLGMKLFFCQAFIVVRFFSEEHK